MSVNFPQALKRQMDAFVFQKSLAGWLLVASLALAIVFIVSAFETGGISIERAVLATSLTAAAILMRKNAASRCARLTCFMDKAGQACAAQSSVAIIASIADLQAQASGKHELQLVLDSFRPALDRAKERLRDAEERLARERKISDLCAEAERLTVAAEWARHRELPHVKAKVALDLSIARLRRLIDDAKRAETEIRDAQRLTWWPTLKNLVRDFWSGNPIRKLEIELLSLEEARKQLDALPDMVRGEKAFNDFRLRVTDRVARAREMAVAAIPDSHKEGFDPDYALRAGAIAAAVSVPISFAGDLSRAHDIYEVLRDHNQNYAALDDFEIWRAMLAMPREQLVGHISLVKGAYHETLVARDSGGVLFENFNHQDTDILIDGVATQIKATNSLPYIDTVKDHIPIIATSEVAEEAGVIDSGYTNEWLTDAVGDALGGSIFDVDDTVVDGVLAGVGVVGVVAIARGVHAAWSDYSLRQNLIAAAGTGGITIVEAKARAVVTMVELIYRGTSAVVTSAPAKRLGIAISDAVSSEKWRTSEAKST